MLTITLPRRPCWHRKCVKSPAATNEIKQPIKSKSSTNRLVDDFGLFIRRDKYFARFFSHTRIIKRGKQIDRRWIFEIMCHVCGSHEISSRMTFERETPEMLIERWSHKVCELRRVYKKYFDVGNQRVRSEVSIFWVSFEEIIKSA